MFFTRVKFTNYAQFLLRRREKKILKIGDIVRFAKWEELTSEQISNSKKWRFAPKDHMGILVKHDKLMGSVDILHEGKILKVRPVFVEKAGKNG